MSEDIINRLKSPLVLNEEFMVSEEIETLEPVKDKNINVEREILKRERKKFEVEKTLAYERIQLEIETLKQERECFERKKKAI